MLYNRKIDRVLILVIPAAIFLYASIGSHKRLNAEMPAEFVDVIPKASLARQAEEERLAHEYWNCALNVIQWKYTYGSPLPGAPPVGFQVDAGIIPKGDSESSAKLRYWQRLQKIWNSPNSWKSTIEWSTSWLSNPISRFLSWLDIVVRDFFHR